MLAAQPSIVAQAKLPTLIHSRSSPKLPLVFTHTLI
jgi:hypothetical protein